MRSSKVIDNKLITIINKYVTKSEKRNPAFYTATFHCLGAKTKMNKNTKKESRSSGNCQDSKQINRKIIREEKRNNQAIGGLSLLSFTNFCAGLWCSEIRIEELL